MANWKLAPALIVMLQEANRIAPKRRRDSDGTIGDTRHQLATSDHNPDSDGMVCALDLGHDPENGWDAHAMVETLRRRRDPRIKYIISNGRIAGPGKSGKGGWEWHPYTGANPHGHHVHVSVTKAGCHDTSPWWLKVQEASVSAAGDVVTAKGRFQVGEYVDQCMRPDGGLWCLKEDGGVINVPAAGPFFGSESARFGKEKLKAARLLPWRGGYCVVATNLATYHHADPTWKS
jgi:hypothetical protein